MASSIGVSASVTAKPSHFRSFYHDVVTAVIPLSASATAGHHGAPGHSTAAPPAGSGQKGQHSAYIVGSPVLEFAGSKAMQRVALAWMAGRLSPFPKTIADFKAFLGDFTTMLLSAPMPRN